MNNDLKSLREFILTYHATYQIKLPKKSKYLCFSNKNISIEAKSNISNSIISLEIKNLTDYTYIFKGVICKLDDFKILYKLCELKNYE